MRHALSIVFSLTLAIPAVAQSPASDASLKKTGSIFDGETLEGWRGRSDLWSVENGAIVGRTTDSDPIQTNTFLVFGGSVPSNFELSCQYKIESGNSGIQYRSRVIDEKEFVVGGYQADIDTDGKFTGINYEEKGRGILTLRGEKTTITAAGKKKKEVFGDAAELAKAINPGQWNQYRVVANGNRLQHFINGQLMSEVIDEQSDKAATDGVIALQLHRGPAMVILFKDLMVIELPAH